MRQIRMNDGTEYPVTLCGASGPSLCINLVGCFSVLEIADAFSDASRTSEITFISPDESTKYTGYTRLYGVVQGSPENTNILVTMLKG